MLSEQESKVIKEVEGILPELIGIKDFVKDASTKIEEIKDMKAKLASHNALMDEIKDKLVTLGKQKVVVHQTGFSREQKMDALKFFVASYKAKNRSGDITSKIMKEVYAKYPVSGFEDDAKAKAALQEGTDTEGGYLVPDAFDGEIWRIAGQNSLILTNGSERPLTRGYKMPVITQDGAVSVTWVDEEGAVVESEPTFAKTTTAAKKMMAKSYLSNELLEDEEGSPSIVDFLFSVFGEKMGQTIDSQALNGTGSPFTGAMRNADVNVLNMGTGELAANLDVDDFIDCEAKLDESSLMGASWVMHKTILAIVRKIEDSNGDKIWTPFAANDPASILGYPYYRNDQMPTATTASSAAVPFILFGNLANILYGTKGGMTMQVLRELKAENDQTGIIFRRRIALATAMGAKFAIIKTGPASS